MNPVVFWEINARDGCAVARFYQDVFQWKTERDSSGFHTIYSGKTEPDENGKNGISGGIFTGEGQLPPHRALYVEVETATEIVRRVQKAGGKVLFETHYG